ncbi:MAG: sugar phosphate nucleotidyltransferase, partial [Patescibacteria group bacterium]
SFVEKPDLTTARQYVSQWQYLWNPGYFIWRVDTLLRQYRQLLPEQYQAFVKINRAFGTPQESAVLTREFTNIKPIAFDYGILERAKNLVVLPADFVFIDIGNWRTVKDILTSSGATTSKGQVISLDSANNLIYNFSKRPIACAGIRDTIIIATDDITLICHQDSAQEVKKIVQQFKEMGQEEYL